jgi:hypothetical protein
MAVPVALFLSLTLVAPALADSVAAEQAIGAQTLTQVQHGTLSPKSLTNDQYQNLGEYLMGRALGSTALHQRMNTLMDDMMGPAASEVMHVYLGKRFLGVSAPPTNRYGQLWGLMSVMMSGYHGSALARMMGGYLNGEGTAGYTTGPGMMGYEYGDTHTTGSNSGWPTVAVIAVIVLTLLLLGGVVAVAAPRLRGRSHAAGAATTKT